MNPLKVVIFNVGTPYDWQNLAIRAQHPEILYDTSLATFSDEQRAEWEKDFQRRFQKLQELEMQSSHDRLVERVFSKITTDFNPDLLEKPSEIMSDHLPVLSVIYFGDN